MVIVPLVLVVVTVLTVFGLWLLLVDRARLILAKPTTEGAADYRAMVLWASSFVAFVAAAVWVALVAIDTIRRNIDAVNRKIVYGGVAAIAVAIALVRPISILRGKPVASLLTRVVEFGDVRIYNVTAVGNPIGAVAVALAGAAVLTLLAVRNEAIERFRQNLAAARLLFHSCAFLLAVGVAEIYFLFDWPSRLQSGVLPEERRPMHTIAQADALMCGVVYSLILLCLYVPLGVWHERRASEISDKLLEASVPGAELLRAERSTIGGLVDLFLFVGPILTALGVPKILAA